MNSRNLSPASGQVGQAIPVILILLLFAGFGAAQVALSAGPLPLHQIGSIYVAPTADDFALLVNARLEKWNVARITAEPEDADAILTCQTTTIMLPAKVVLWRTIAEANLVDRRSQRLIWKTAKTATYDTTGLADDIMEQLKKDWRKSALQY